nr:hypothetical protein Iba_chr12cCG6170 [Ipomoea batatas]
MDECGRSSKLAEGDGAMGVDCVDVEMDACMLSWSFELNLIVLHLSFAPFTLLLRRPFPCFIVFLKFHKKINKHAICYNTCLETIAYHFIFEPKGLFQVPILAKPMNKVVINNNIRSNTHLFHLLKQQLCFLNPPSFTKSTYSNAKRVDIWYNTADQNIKNLVTLLMKSAAELRRCSGSAVRHCGLQRRSDGRAPAGAACSDGAAGCFATELRAGTSSRQTACSGGGAFWRWVVDGGRGVRRRWTWAMAVELGDGGGVG